MSEETKTAPKAVKTFEAKAPEIQVTMEHPERPSKEVTFVFGHLVTTKEGEDEKRIGRFNVSVPIVIDGMEGVAEGSASKADKALDMAIRNANLGTIDDWTVTLEGEYFEQKYTAPKVDKDDFWTNNKFADLRDEITALRDEAELKAEAVENAKEGAQQESIEFAQLLKSMLDKVGGTLKVLESIVRGPKGEGNNHPRMQRLGSGTNALREALRFADLTPLMNSVIPSSITSGKALDTHKSRAVTKLCADVANTKDLVWPAGLQTGGRAQLPDITSLGKLLRQLARRSFRVEAAETDAMSLDEVMQEAAANGMEAVVDFQQKYGKEANSYNKTEYEAALLAYGRVLAVGSDGDQLLIKAADDLQKLAVAVEEADDPEKVLVEGMSKIYNNNLVAKRLVETAWAHKIEVDKETEQRELLKGTEEDSPISGAAAKKLAQLTPDQQAAHIVQMIARLPAPGSVFAKVKSLGTQLGLKDPEVQEAAE